MRNPVGPPLNLSWHCENSVNIVSLQNLDEMLRDKLVNGLKDMQTQRQFFEISEEKLPGKSRANRIGG